MQSDIERENTVFYNTEVKRLTLIETSVKAKVEELARRADDKAKTMNELEQMQRPETENEDSILDNTFEGVLKLKEKILTPLRESDAS